MKHLFFVAALVLSAGSAFAGELDNEVFCYQPIYERNCGHSPLIRALTMRLS